MDTIALLVLAEEPLPGRAKTRLTPPCTPRQAAGLAGASLLDTLDVVARTPAARRVLVFDGDATGWRQRGFEVIEQSGRDLGERLAAAFTAVAAPALLVGMDTPQVTPRLLREGMDALMTPGVDAVLGPALDGGYWSIGFRRSVAGAFAGVPMSCASTFTRQRTRLRELGLQVREQAWLRDIDTIEDARAVATTAPHTRFARRLAAL